MARISILKRQSDESIDTHLNKFQRKTKRGKILRVTRERYLRNDIGCGSPACSACRVHHDKLAKTVRASEGRTLTLLSSEPSKGNKAIKGSQSYYLVLDTNVVLHQMDLLEATIRQPQASAKGKSKESPAITSVIVLQTVLDEVRHRSLPLFNRLQALIREPERNYWVYWNDFSEYVSTYSLSDLETNFDPPADRQLRRKRSMKRQTTPMTGPFDLLQLGLARIFRLSHLQPPQS